MATHSSVARFSSLENPRDGGAWWAAVCGVAQSRTRLKRLSSSGTFLRMRRCKNPGSLNSFLSYAPQLLLLLLSRFSRVRLCATPQTAAHQAPPSMGFPRQEYWSGLPFPSPGDPPDPGIELTSLKSLALAGGFITSSSTCCCCCCC